MALKKKKKKEISISCCLIILMLCQLLSFSHSVHKPGKFNGLRSGLGSHSGSTGSKAGFVGDGALAGEKRKVYTGSNPLHNR